MYKPAYEHIGNKRVPVRTYVMDQLESSTCTITIHEHWCKNIYIPLDGENYESDNIGEHKRAICINKIVDAKQQRHQHRKFLSRI